MHQEVLEKIVELLRAVDGVGVVIDYMQQNANLDNLAGQIQNGSTVGAVVKHGPCEAEKHTEKADMHKSVFIIDLLKRMDGKAGPSEPEIMTVAARVMNVFSLDRKLSGTVHQHGLMQVEVVQDVELGPGVFFHHAGLLIECLLFVPRAPYVVEEETEETTEV